MKKVMMFALLCMLCLGAGFAAGGAETAGAGSSTGTAPALSFVTGSVTVDGKVAKAGMVLVQGAVIQTGAGSSADIVFQERNIVRIGQNSRLRLDFSAVARELNLERGSATSVLQKLEKLGTGDSFRIRTPLANAGVRGTSFCVWVSQDSTETYVCACNGRIHADDAEGGNGELMESAHHKARIFRRDGSGITKVEGTLLHHDDASVQAVAERIGHVISWGTLED